MDQSTYQSAVRDTIQALAAFADVDVVINDYTILDGPVTNAPYVIIGNVVTARITERMGGIEEGTLELPFAIYEAFDGWETSLNNLRDREDAVINGFNGSAWSANGAAGVSIQFVRLEARLELYEPGVEEPMSDPVFLVRPVVLEMELY